MNGEVQLQGLLQRDHRLPAHAATAAEAGLQAAFRNRRRQAGEGRLCAVSGRVQRRARRDPHPVAVHARPQPPRLTLKPVLRDPGSADRAALPHRRFRRHGGRAVRAALRPGKDGNDWQGRNGVLQYNTDLVALLHHYSAEPSAFRPYPAKKGKIERPYRHVR